MVDKYKSNIMIENAKANTVDGVVEIFTEMPLVWKNKHAYNLRDESEWFQDGFRDYVDVEVNEYQNKSEIILINNVYTHNVTDKSPSEVIEIKNERYDYLLLVVFNKVREYARALAMGKSIDDDLDYYELAYTNKYNMCKGLIPDPNNTIATEASLEGYPSTQAYKDYVIVAYDAGKMFRNQAIQMLEVVRKRVILDKDNDDIDTALTRLTMIDNLPKDIKVEDVDGVFTNIMTVNS